MTFALLQIRRNGSEFTVCAFRRRPKSPPSLSNAEVARYILRMNRMPVATGYLRASRQWDARD